MDISIGESARRAGVGQSPGKPSTRMPVILPAASKPNGKLVASQRGKTNFKTQKFFSPS